MCVLRVVCWWYPAARRAGPHCPGAPFLSLSRFLQGVWLQVYDAFPHVLVCAHLLPDEPYAAAAASAGPLLAQRGGAGL